MSEARKAVYGIGLINGMYQGSVAQRAFRRAGHCRNLKGHVLEICYKDRFNVDIRNIVTGKRAYLTKSPYAARDDIIVKQAGRVEKRFQCKDTPSSAGVQDTVNRIKLGQYARTNVIGTSETADAVNRSLDKARTKTLTRIQDSKISTKTTELIACQVNGANPLEHLDLVGHYSGKMAKGGAVLGSTVSLVKNGNEVIRGKMDLDEAIVSVAADTGKIAASAGVAGAVDVSVTMAVATVPPLLLVAKPIGMASGVVVGCVVDKAFKTAGRCMDRHIDKIVNKSIVSASDSYAYLKEKGFI